ncbi:MAG TPA: hypothetical protein VGF34_13365 [Stellaceae bacterium]|jgi:hypothetical protein
MGELIMRRCLALFAALALSSPCHAATPFLWQPGASNSGLYSPPLTLMSTELNGLASGAVATSSMGGAGGVYSNASTAQVIWSPMVLTLGPTAGAMQTGANVSCWLLPSIDGLTFESSASAPPRAPDAVFPLPAATLSASATFLSQGLVRVPALKFKVLCQNNSGQALNAAGNTVVLAPTAVQY